MESVQTTIRTAAGANGGQTGDQTDTSSNHDRHEGTSHHQTQNAARMDEIKSKTQRITSSLTNTMTAVGIVGGIGTAGFDKYFSEIEVTEGSRIHETDMTKNHRQHHSKVETQISNVTDQEKGENTSSIKKINKFLMGASGESGDNYCLESGEGSSQVQYSTYTKQRSPKKHRGAEILNQSSSGSDSNFSADENSPPFISKNKNPKLSTQIINPIQDSNTDSSPLLKDTPISKDSDRYIIPPPEDLIAKTVFLVEPIRTGAPISFVKIDDLRGEERKQELMAEPKPKTTAEQEIASKPSNKYIADEIVKADKDGRIVYCRFGKQYIINLEKQINSLLNNNIGGGAQLSTAIKSATYLINIKKLIKEHNIDTEHNQFQKMRTKTNVVNKQGDNGPALPYYNPQDVSDVTLQFESRFESGNLLCAMKVSDNEYDLVLQNDINTNGHTQWYFFRVGNTHQGMKVKFNVLNLAKLDSLYNEGMKILAFSSDQKKEKNLGWHRVGSEISYFQNQFKRENLRFTRYYYTFTFTHEFEGADGDQVYFAHCFPYTYSDLQDDLSRIEKDAYTQNFFYRNTLCRTLAGNKCEYITITSKEKDPLKNGGAQPSQKKGVFLSARVHPGESNSSWMMKGLIEFLVSNAPEARVLREKFVFKIVPMINPDGVINGNYRCSLCGSDLNRRWKTPSKVLHPVVFAIKRMVKAFSKEREIALYCDFHGHSRRKNIFMYGNNYSEKPDTTRVFPYILSKLCDYFSFEYCRFSMHKSKEATARIAMWKELKIPNIFTMEASFSGADKGVLKDQHFTSEHLMMSGRKVLEALIVYCKIDVQACLNELNYKNKHKKNHDKNDEEEIKFENNYLSFNVDCLQKELQDNKELLKLTEGKEDGEGGGSSGSDSDPSEDNLEEEEMAKIVPIKIRKKKPELKKKNEGPSQSPTKNIKSGPQKAVTRSPVKKIFNYSNPLYDRLKLRQAKRIEMIDAWTQTSDKGSDNEEAKKLHRVGSQANQKPKASLLNATGQQSFSLMNQNNPDLQNTTSHQINSQNSDPYLNLNQSQKVSMQDSGSSPQPQIRIRKEPFKQPSLPVSLTKFEEKLYNGSKVGSNLNNSMINHTGVLDLQNKNQASEDSQQSSNNSSSRLSKTPQDKYGKNYITNSNNNAGNNLNFTGVNNIAQNLSMKMSKSPYNAQIYSEVTGQNSDLQQRQFQSTGYKVTDPVHHNRHYSSENINQLTMGGVSNSSNALSSRGNKDSQLSQFNHISNKDSYNNNNSTTVTSPKSLQNPNKNIVQNLRNKSQKVSGIVNNTNILYANMNSLNQDQYSMQQQQQQQLSSGNSNNQQQQQQRFKGSLLTKEAQDISRSNANGQISGGTQKIISVMTTSGFTNQRQSIIQNSLDKSQLRGQNPASNKKRLPEINDANRGNQKTTLEQTQNPQNSNQLNTNHHNHHPHIIQQQQQVVISHGKHQQHNPHYKYSGVNNSHQQLIRNQNIFQIQQSLIKNYGGTNAEAFTAANHQLVNHNALITHSLAKSMDRNSASFQQRTSNYQTNNYVNNSGMGSTSGGQSMNNNNINNNSANVVLNSHSEYQQRALQQQIQLQNVKMRTNLDQITVSSNGGTSASNTHHTNKTPQKQYL